MTPVSATDFIASVKRSVSENPNRAVANKCAISDKKLKLAIYHRAYYKRRSAQILAAASNRRAWDTPESKDKRREYRNRRMWFYTCNSAGRRAKSLGLYHSEANRSKILAIYEMAQRVQRCIGVGMSVDHIIPMSSGGWHHEANLQVIPLSSNIRSKNRDVFWDSSDHMCWKHVPDRLWPVGLTRPFRAILIVDEMEKNK